MSEWQLTQRSAFRDPQTPDKCAYQPEAGIPICRFRRVVPGERAACPSQGASDGLMKGVSKRARLNLSPSPSWLDQLPARAF